MALITINIPDAQMARVVAALSERFGYAPILEDGTPNPLTRAQFVKARIGQWIREETREHELAAARASVTVPEVTPT